MRMPRHHRPVRRPAAHGFTLIELIIVIVLLAIIGTTVALFVKPSIDAFVGVKGRAALSDLGDTALRRVLRDVRHAVPNSLRSPSSNCFELVPAVSGGRFRMGPDITNDTGNCCAAYVDPSQQQSSSTNPPSFDVLSTLSTAPAVGDWVVVNNQNGNDVYESIASASSNRTAITAVSTPAVATMGTTRITMAAGTFKVSPGYNGGRFQIVKDSEQSVFYICSGAGTDANGDGTGTLYRLKRSFTATYPTSCPATTGATVLATNVQSCSFIYNPNQGATQQSGFLWMQLVLSRRGENSSLAVGAHVMNVP